MKTKKRIKASSLVETMIAMVLIIIAFGAGNLIYHQILRTEYLEAKAIANARLHNLLETAKEEASLKEERIEIEGMLIEKTVEQSPWAADTYLLHLQAYDGSERLICELKEIIYLLPK